MAVKRRAVWFSDETWAALRKQAEAQGCTVSALIGELLIYRHLPPAEPSFNSRPFTPVPKRHG